MPSLRTASVPGSWGRFFPTPDRVGSRPRGRGPPQSSPPVADYAAVSALGQWRGGDLRATVALVCGLREGR